MGGVSQGGGCRREQWQVERPGKQLWSVVPGMRGDASRKSVNGNEETTTEAPLKGHPGDCNWFGPHVTGKGGGHWQQLGRWEVELNWSFRPRT